jgi:hypothetical protein
MTRPDFLKQLIAHYHKPENRWTLTKSAFSDSFFACLDSCFDDVDEELITLDEVHSYILENLSSISEFDDVEDMEWHLCHILEGEQE